MPSKPQPTVITVEVSGPTGSGKTALMSMIRRMLSSDNVMVASTDLDQALRTRPYGVSDYSVRQRLDPHNTVVVLREQNTDPLPGGFPGVSPVSGMQANPPVDPNAFTIHATAINEVKPEAYVMPVFELVIERAMQPYLYQVIEVRRDENGQIARKHQIGYDFSDPSKAQAKAVARADELADEHGWGHSDLRIKRPNIEAIMAYHKSAGQCIGAAAGHPIPGFAGAQPKRE